MSSTALQRDALMPRSPDGMGTGLMLALLAHALLVVALAFGVNWRTSQPAGIEAELWAATPQFAAPRATAPEPAPPPPEVKRPVPVAAPEPPAVKAPDPQIAIEKAKREEAKREEAKREEAQREQLREQQREKDELARKQKEQERKAAAALEAERAKNLQRMLGQAGATEPGTTPGNAAQTAGPSAGYAGRIKARIKPNIVFADSVNGNPLATVEVRLAPDGTIINKRLVKSSGVPAWDDAVLRAIDKTEVLPRDTDGRVPPPFEIDFRPRD
jgi:colicin import membrane protein